MKHVLSDVFAMARQLTRISGTGRGAAVLCVLFTGLLLAGVAQAAGNITVIGGLTRYASLKPGGKAEGRILVRNLGTDRSSLAVE